MKDDQQKSRSNSQPHQQNGYQGEEERQHSQERNQEPTPYNGEPLNQGNTNE